MSYKFYLNGDKISNIYSNNVNFQVMTTSNDDEGPKDEIYNPTSYIKVTRNRDVLNFTGGLTQNEIQSIQNELEVFFNQNKNQYQSLEDNYVDSNGNRYEFGIYLLREGMVHNLAHGSDCGRSRLYTDDILNCDEWKNGKNLSLLIPSATEDNIQSEYDEPISIGLSYTLDSFNFNYTIGNSLRRNERRFIRRHPNSHLYITFKLGIGYTVLYDNGKTSTEKIYNSGLYMFKVLPDKFKIYYK